MTGIFLFFEKVAVSGYFAKMLKILPIIPIKGGFLRKK